jgi:hypothetical protein
MVKEVNKSLFSSTEEVRDIIERLPVKAGRIATIIVVSLTGLLLFFGWMIEYPEKVTGPVFITASQAPVKLVANSSGRLNLLKSNSETLKENEIFASIENSAQLNDIIQIEEALKGISCDSLFIKPLFIETSISQSLGELSIQYYTFLNSIEKVKQYRYGKPYEKKLRSLVSLLNSQFKLKKNTWDQLKTKKNTLKVAEKSVHRDSTLFRSSTIAEIDIDRSSIDYYGILASKQTMEKDNTSLGIQIEDTKYKLQVLFLEQKEFESKLRMDLISSYNELIASIRKWKLTYCFISPIEGTLEYLNFWRENDFITAGTGVFSVLPSNNPILGQVYLPSQGAGKVLVGQDVIIRLDNYPYLEYGSISGKVKTISQLSNQTAAFTGQNSISTYLITLDLPKNLTTNYGADLDFRYEIKGIADILIKRRKLLERLFDNLKYIVSKK